MSMNETAHLIANAGARPKTVLLVEDDPTLRSLLRRTLESLGYKVHEAENGKVATKVFEEFLREIGFIISDIKMPELDGVGLLRYVRMYTNMPVILMTGFSEIMESQQAYELGANEFIAKPFSKQVLVKAIEKALRSVGPSATEQGVSDESDEPEDQKYCAIHIDEFISSTKLLSDIYVKLGGQKFIKVAYKGDLIPVERLKTYRDKKVEYLHVTLSDFSRYVDFNLKLSSSVLAGKRVSPEKKARLLKHTTESVVKECFVGELDPRLLKPAEEMVNNTLALVASDEALLDIFLDLQSQSDKLYAQGVAVALIGCLVAKLHGWMSSQTQTKVSLSGLLHDIGLKEIDPKIIMKRRVQRSSEETRLYESHATRSRDLVMQVKCLPEDIATIVHQHHESYSGTGYPMQIRGERVHPIARLIGTVDSFVDLILPVEEGVDPMRPREAVRSLMEQLHTGSDRTFMIRIAELFQVDP